jgi:NitT/TauT family transport system permease protein
MKSALPVTIVLAAIFASWYVAAALMNAPLQRDAFANADRADYSTLELIDASLAMERPKLPAPHQIVAELGRLIFETAPTSKRGLVYHAWITLQETLIGFFFGVSLGIGLAVVVISAPPPRTIDDAVDRRFADRADHRAGADDRGDPQSVQRHWDRA